MIGFNKPRILALYLPQFHRLPENDAWWGEGFTDWVAAKQARPLFPGHEQPHLPYRGNYYDLTKPESLQWQAEIMNNYGIDGVCIYHYWFKDGYQILEKPAEILLQSKDIKMNFCFSWANEPWIRSWGNLNNANPWSEVMDKKVVHDASDNGILIEQNYGGIEEWEKHFRYLLPFFQDNRYLRQDGKPIFMFYRPQAIGCLRDMVNCWRSLAEKSGLSGLYLMGANTDAQTRSILDEAFLQEPQETLAMIPKTYRDCGVAKYVSYEEVWKNILIRPMPEFRASLGGFTGYDDSPRRGRNSTVVYGKSQSVFKNSLVKLFRKAIKNEVNFVILNAWNEWGEGMYLEPDEKEGFAYLKAVQDARQEALKQMGDSHEWEEERLGYEKAIEELRSQNSRYRSWWQLMNSLLCLYDNDISLGKYLAFKGFNKVAIYGMGMVGKHLTAKLKLDGVTPAFAIDQSRNKLVDGFPLIGIDDDPLSADIILVTVVHDYLHIELKLKEKYICPIVSLQTFLDEIPIVKE